MMLSQHEFSQYAMSFLTMTKNEMMYELLSSINVASSVAEVAPARASMIALEICVSPSYMAIACCELGLYSLSTSLYAYFFQNFRSNTFGDKEGRDVLFCYIILYQKLCQSINQSLPLLRKY